MGTKIIGHQSHQAPRNADLGTLAFQDSDSVGSLRARNIAIGEVADASNAYALTLSRSVGGSGVLKIIGDNYLTGNPHIKFELEPTSGATIKNGMISFDGDAIKQSTTRIDSSMGRDHQNNIPSLDIYHYNYPDDGTQNVPALRIRNGNSNSDNVHHGFFSLESLFTGSSYESPRIYFKNTANNSNDRAIAGMYLSTGAEPNLTFITDLLGSSENYSDITPYTMATISKSGISLGSNMNANGGSFYNNNTATGYGIIMDSTVSGQDRLPTIRQVARYNAGTVSTAEIYTDSSGTIFHQLNSSRVNTFKSNGQSTFSVGGVNIKNKLSISGTEATSSITTAGATWIRLASVPYGESNGRVRVHWDSISAPNCCHHGYIELQIGSWYGSQYFYGWDSNISINHSSAHNNFKFAQFKLVDAGSTLYLLGKANTAIVSGSLTVRVIEDNSYAPGAVSSGISPITPVQDNTYYATSTAFVDVSPRMNGIGDSAGSRDSDKQVMQGTSGMHYARNGYMSGRSVEKVYANPNGVSFQINTASNGAASFFMIEGNQYHGYRRTYFSCINASGNWTLTARDDTTHGTAPTYTVGNNGTANPTITLNFNSSYSGGFAHVKYDHVYWFQQ